MRRLLSVVVLLGLGCAASPATESSAVSQPPSLARATRDPATAAQPDSRLDPLIVKTAQASAHKMKIRVNAEGGIVKQALYHDQSTVIPQPVLEAAKAKFPGSTPVHYELELYAELGRVFEVEVKTSDGRQCELAAHEDGTELYTECRVDPAELDPTILATVEREALGGTLLEAEHKTGPEMDEFTVEVDSQGVELYLQIASDGSLLSKHKRVPAVVEVPL